MLKGLFSAQGRFVSEAAGRGESFREGDAALGEGDALAGKVEALCVVDERHHRSGSLHIGAGAGECFSGVALGEGKQHLDKLAFGEGGGLGPLAATLLASRGGASSWPRRSDRR